MKLIKLPPMTDDEINTAVNSLSLCRIAFIDGQFPYIAPFQYVIIDNVMYFHLTDYGKKKKILEENPNVCVSIEEFETDLSNYYFISIQGKLQKIEKEDLKNEVLRQMTEQARKIYSKNFLSAHGMDKEKEWDILTSKNQLIYKLEVVKPPIGLKSL